MGIGERPPPISIRNSLGFAYLSSTQRLSINPDTGIMIVEDLIDGIWQPASFETGPACVWVGLSVGIAAAGHHILTENANEEFHFHTHSDFDGKLSLTDAKTLYAFYDSVRQVTQADESNEWIGKSFSWTEQSTIHGLLRKGYWKTGSIAATEAIRIQNWEGTDENGDLVFDQTYPVSQFPADSEVETIEHGFIELIPGQDIYTKISSAVDFSLKTNAAETKPWNAIDISMARYDNLLQTAEWIDGATYSKGQYFIDGRKIYICNITGVQTGTFENNSDKWDELSDHLIDETDPLFTAWDKSTGISITESQISDLDHFDNADETDPIFSVSPAAVILAQDILNWDAAYGWGDHALAGYLTEETDPIFSAWDKSTGIEITESQITDLDHFTTEDETDPLFTAWDKSTGISIIESQISDLSHFSGAIADLTGDGPLQFLAVRGQKINLYSDTYALGVESGELRIASNQAISFRTGGYSGTERMLLSESGTLDVPYRVNTPILRNSSGLLKIQPNANGDVELFGDTDVDNSENSKIFKIWRRAPEGNDYIRFYVSSGRNCFIHSSNKLTLQAQNPFTINSITEDIIFKVGDNAGVKKFYFQDSDGNDVAIIDSNGNAYFEGDLDCNEVETINGLKAGGELEVGGSGIILGDMGIGIATPDEKLHIYDGKIRIEADSEDPTLYFTDNDDDATFGFLFDRSEDDLHLVYNASSRNPSFLDDMMTFTHQHRVGIMNPDPTCELDIGGDLNVGGDITLTGTVDGYDISGLQAALDLKAPKNSPIFTGDLIVDTDTLFVDSTNKRIGIGTLDPKEEVHIKSDHPTITFEEADAASNEKVWEFGATAEEFLFRTANDLHTGNQTIFKASGRGGTTVTEFSIPNANVAIGTDVVGDAPLKVAGLVEYANNAAAISGGLTVGEFYRNGATTDKVCVVH